MRRVIIPEISEKKDDWKEKIKTRVKNKSKKFKVLWKPLKP